MSPVISQLLRPGHKQDLDKKEKEKKGSNENDPPASQDKSDEAIKPNALGKETAVAKARPRNDDGFRYVNKKNRSTHESANDFDTAHEQRDNPLMRMRARRTKGDRTIRSLHRKNRRRRFIASVDEALITPSQTKPECIETEQKPSTPSKDPFEANLRRSSNDNRYTWSLNLLNSVTTVSIRKEFIQNKKYTPQEYTFEHYKRNTAKNRKYLYCEDYRYEDVICMDSNRVILKQRPPDDDYIHASWMVMPDGQRYICTQGPVQETLEDFWHMVITEQCCVVVMLCSLREGDFLI
ncbi:hypothetical protein DICVIV_10574 [Dictyocaulus viviparus]|uniref:Tyrosine-protein phosphatase domain-containing protein n=1 Tax=Dictyocaulus viviparus TaxID=29172 RepID=A0A0D8XM10_DICVI|nr:hypothetical protein DICVIV_10574 [Dictyocaulus viviparus]